MWSLFILWVLPLRLKMVFSIIPALSHDERATIFSWSIIVLIVLHGVHWFLSYRVLMHAQGFHLPMHCELIWVVWNHRLVDHFLLYDFIHCLSFLINLVLGHCEGWNYLPLLRNSLIRLAIRIDRQLRQMWHGVLLVILSPRWGLWFASIIWLFVVSLLPTLGVVDILVEHSNLLLLLFNMVSGLILHLSKLNYI